MRLAASRSFLTIFAILVLAGGAFAQSGRRVDAKPSPLPAPTVETPDQYSESTPRPGRIARPRAQPAQATAAPAGQAGSGGDDEIVRVETNLITIPVSVFDRNGLYIPNLRQSDFKIYEDGIEQEIAYFGTSDKPFTIALVLDTSPSTEYRIEEIKRAATAFVNLLEPQDSVIVIEFNWDVKVRTKATQDREKILKAINKANFGQGTSLYTAVDEAVRKQLGKVPGRKAVVLFTDGVDTTSGKATYDSTLNYAEESDTLIFPIYYNTYLENRRRNSSTWPDIFGGGPMQGVSAADYALGRRYLDDLANATGGRVFRPEATPGGLTAAFEGIAEELRRQYNIGYVPTREGVPGQRKSIKVRVNRPNLIIRARDSYIVGTAPPGPAPAAGAPVNESRSN
jgi:Ca-activated chloride channel homolog